MSQHALIEEIEKIEMSACRDFYEAAPASVRAALGIEARAIGRCLLLLCPGVDNLVFNRLIGLGVFAPAELAEVDAALAAFDTAGVKNGVAHFAEGAEGVELVASSRSLTPHKRTWAKFARDASPAREAVTDLSIREVGAEGAAALGTVVAKGFGCPGVVADWVAALPGRRGWHCFGAFYGTDLVASGVVFTDGPNAWFGFGATLEEYRGRGAQAALLAARIEAARAAGCSILSTETGIPHEGEPAPSFKNILRAGFLVAYSRPNLRRAPV
jgi:GNAT superfamily N-acetyltransferase